MWPRPSCCATGDEAITKSKSISEQIEVIQHLAQGAAAWLVGVKPRTLRDRQASPRNGDGTYNGRELVAWHLEQTTDSSEADPLLAGGGSDSPALERFREARADREELELSIRRGQMIDVDEFLTWYDVEVIAPMRRGMTSLQKKYGPEAVDLVGAPMRRTKENVSRRFK